MMTLLPLSERNVGFRHRRSSHGSSSALAETYHSGFPTPVIRYHRSVFYRLAVRGGALLHKCALQQTAVKASIPTATFVKSP
jgi:hypothetical protein